MQCPMCHQALRGLDYQGVHIETCPACGGDWLDAGELGNMSRLARPVLQNRNVWPWRRRRRSRVSN